VSLNMSTLRHQIDGTLQAGMMDFLKGASSFSHRLLLLRFVVAFCDLHRLIVQNTRRQTYEIPQDWNCDPHRDDVTVRFFSSYPKLMPCTFDKGDSGDD
jgi:hypothetical protein